MISPLVEKVFEMNEFVWKHGPYFRSISSWIKDLKQFQIHSYNSTLPWMVSSIFIESCLLFICIFLVFKGLYHPFNNYIINWMATLQIIVFLIFVITTNFYVGKNRDAVIGYFNCILLYNPRVSYYQKFLAKRPYKTVDLSCSIYRGMYAHCNKISKLIEYCIFHA